MHPARLADETAELADELERVAVLDEALEQRELGLEPLRVDGLPDARELRVSGQETRLGSRWEGPCS